MPEARELVAEFLRTQHGLRSDLATANGGSLYVRHIWCDATSDEQDLMVSVPPTQRQYVQTLQPDCKYQRGQKDHQTALFPPIAGSGPGAVKRAGLQLSSADDIRLTYRAIHIDFHCLAFSVRTIAALFVVCVCLY